MRVHGRTLLAAALLAFLLAVPARGFDDAGETPVGLVWSAPDAARTPVLIAPAGAAPASQRVAYGVVDAFEGARVVVRALEKPGAEAGPATTLGIDDLGADPAAFGSDGGVGLAGAGGPWALAAHNDNGRIEIARIDLAGATSDGARGDEEYVLPRSAGCRVEATPLVAYGALWLAAGGGCSHLWRIPLDPAARLGTPESVEVPALDAGTSPVATGLGGAPHVTVAAGASLTHVRGEGVPAVVATTPLPDGDVPRAPLVAGDSIFVAARTLSGATRVHRLGASDGSVTRSSGAFGGAPGPGLAHAAGTLVVTSSGGVHTVDAATLAVSPTGLEEPHSRTVAAAAGPLAHVVSDAGAPEVLRLPRGEPVAPSDFDRVALGSAHGAPASARGYLAAAGVEAVTVHRTRDVTPPVIELIEPARARAGDARGVERVDFRLMRPGGVPEVVATVTEPAEGNPFAAPGAVYAADLGDPARGTYLADAVAVDATGNSTTSGRLTLRVGSPGSRRGRCTNPLRGSPRMDVLRGTRSGDRLVGAAGDDALVGGAGGDCLQGGAGRDRLNGGAGRDRLVGGPGRDRVRCGPGRDRVVADRRDCVARDCERVRRREPCSAAEPAAILRRSSALSRVSSSTPFSSATSRRRRPEFAASCTILDALS